MPPNVLPSPPDFAAGSWAAWGFFFVAGAAAVLLALPWALYGGIRKGNWIPLLAMGSGLLCSLVEPMLDFLGHLRWANDLPGPAFVNFGIDIPYLIPPCYMAFLGLESYFSYFMLKKGITVRQCFVVFAVGGLTDAIMETIGLNLHVYEYYGVQPYSLFKFPYWWGFINGASFFTCGFLLWYLVPRLQGLRKLWLLLVSPTGMMTTYFACGWPHILALNAAIPTWTKWVVTTIMMGLCLVLIRGIAHFAAIPEPTHRWTFLRVFFYRVMTNGARARLEERIAVARAVPAMASATQARQTAMRD